MEDETAVSPSAVGGGRYQLTEVVGRGGSSVVWRAFDLELQREVAVKILAGAAAADPTLHRRFYREARRVASMTHPNIVPVYDFGIDRGQSFIVMEYLDGPSLRQILKSFGALPIPSVAKVAVDTLSALGHAHERGIVHRDVKPGNILVSMGGEVKVVDFGVAKSFDETTDLTVLGSFIGTATYASPEQFMGGQIGPESDLYSLGCVLYHCVAGRPPFEADDVEKLILQHRFADPRPIGTVRADVPRSMGAAIMSALEKDPGTRVRGTVAMSRGFAPHVGDGFVGTGLPILRPDSDEDDRTPRENGRDHDLGADRHSKTGGDRFRDLIHLPVDGTRRSRRRLWLTLSLVAIGIIGGIAVATQLIWSAPRTAGTASRLASGGFLQPGQFLSSANHRFTLVMQSDGNLVDYADRRTVPIWATGTSGNFDSYVVMQPDGDLVVYPHGKSAPPPGQPTSALWSSGSSGHNGSFLELANNGGLTVRQPGNHRPVWESLGQPH